MKKTETTKPLSYKEADTLLKLSITDKELLKLYETLKFQDFLTENQILRLIVRKSARSFQEITNLILNSKQ